MKIIIFRNYKHKCLIHTWTDKAFKGSIVNRIFLHEGSLAITLHYSSFKQKIFILKYQIKNIKFLEFNFLMLLISTNWDSTSSTLFILFSNFCLLVDKVVVVVRNMFFFCLEVIPWEDGGMIFWWGKDLK